MRSIACFAEYIAEKPKGQKGLETMPNLDNLYDYQTVGRDWLRSPRDPGFGFKCPPYHGLLADDMGLGKTAQVLDALKPLLKEGKRILFMVPGSTVIQWQKS